MDVIPGLTLTHCRHPWPEVCMTVAASLWLHLHPLRHLHLSAVPALVLVLAVLAPTRGGKGRGGRRGSGSGHRGGRGGGVLRIVIEVL